MTSVPPILNLGPSIQAKPKIVAPPAVIQAVPPVLPSIPEAAQVSEQHALQNAPVVAPPLQPLVQNDSFRAQQENALQNQIQRLMPHPEEPGFWHKLGHIASTVGNIAGDVFAPRAMALIPGTQLNNQMQLSAAEKNLAGLQARDQAEQQQAEENAQNQQKIAIDQERANTEAQQKPAKPTSPWRLVNDYEGPNGEPVEQNEETGEYRVAPVPAGVKRVTAQPKVPVPTPKAGTLDGHPAWGNYVPGQGWVDPETGRPIPGFAPQIPYSMTGLYQPTMGYGPNGQMVPGAFNERTGRFTPNAAGGAAAIPKDAQAQLGKELETAREADKKLRTMEENEQAALNGDQQAMLSLVANHIGMTLGAQKGARINQAVWNEAVKSAPFLQNVVKKFGPDGYLQGVVLSPEQIKQMVDLGRVVDQQQWNEANQAFQQYGVPLQEHPETNPQPFTVPEGAPAAPKENGKYLYADGKAVAKSENGKWVAP